MIPAPVHPVRDVEDRPGPKGGNVRIYSLGCGHSIWIREKGPPKTRKSCTACWLNATDKENHRPMLVTDEDDPESLRAKNKELQDRIDGLLRLCWNLTHETPYAEEAEQGRVHTALLLVEIATIRKLIGKVEDFADACWDKKPPQYIEAVMAELLTAVTVYRGMKKGK